MAFHDTAPGVTDFEVDVVGADFTGVFFGGVGVVVERFADGGVVFLLAWLAGAPVTSCDARWRVLGGVFGCRLWELGKYGFESLDTVARPLSSDRGRLWGKCRCTSSHELRPTRAQLQRTHLAYLDFSLSSDNEVPGMKG